MQDFFLEIKELQEQKERLFQEVLEELKQEENQQ